MYKTKHLFPPTANELPVTGYEITSWVSLTVISSMSVIRFCHSNFIVTGQFSNCGSRTLWGGGSGMFYNIWRKRKTYNVANFYLCMFLYCESTKQLLQMIEVIF
jgi:hypothetical protein